jgi:hypothetical protein
VGAQFVAREAPSLVLGSLSYPAVGAGSGAASGAVPRGGTSAGLAARSSIVGAAGVVGDAVVGAGRMGKARPVEAWEGIAAAVLGSTWAHSAVVGKSGRHTCDADRAPRATQPMRGS